MSGKCDGGGDGSSVRNSKTIFVFLSCSFSMMPLLSPLSLFSHASHVFLSCSTSVSLEKRIFQNE
jgi:hypothetical protein